MPISVLQVRVKCRTLAIQIKSQSYPKEKQKSKQCFSTQLQYAQCYVMQFIASDNNTMTFLVRTHAWFFLCSAQRTSKQNTSLSNARNGKTKIRLKQTNTCYFYSHTHDSTLKLEQSICVSSRELWVEWHENLIRTRYYLLHLDWHEHWQVDGIIFANKLDFFFSQPLKITVNRKSHAHGFTWCVQII